MVFCVKLLALAAIVPISVSNAVTSSQELPTRKRLFHTNHIHENNNENETSRDLSQICGTNPLDSSSNTHAGTGYHQWKSSLLPSQQFPNDLYIPTAHDPCTGLTFHWKIDKKKASIRIAVAVKDAGWSAIGFSETGGMKGADVVYFETATGELVDAHVGDAYVRPTRDVYQDWTLLSSLVTDDGFLIFEAERALFTNLGHEDKEIVDDSGNFVVPYRIIGAWSDGDSLSFHGKNVVRSSVQLFSSDTSEAGPGSAFSDFQKAMSERADEYAILKLNNYTIPEKENTYYSHKFTVDDLVDLGLYADRDSSTHIIGMEFLFDPTAAKYVHHCNLYGYKERGPREMVAGWSKGDQFLSFPKGSGLEFGGNEIYSFKSIDLELHFYNPYGDANLVDNGSGIKLYYTNSPVEHEIGMMTVTGFDAKEGAGASIGEGKSKHMFQCPSCCTGNRFAVDEVTIIYEAYHMHAKGKRAVGEVYRGDRIVHTANLDYWDFNQVSCYCMFLSTWSEQSAQHGS